VHLHSILTNLLALGHAGLPLLPVHPHLLSLGHAGLFLMPVHPHLLSLRHAGLRLVAGLLALCAHLNVLRTLRPLRRREALLALHPRLRKGLPLHPRSGISTATTAATLIHLRALATAPATVIRDSGLTVPAATTAVGSRIRRGRDR